MMSMMIATLQPSCGLLLSLVLPSTCFVVPPSWLPVPDFAVNTLLGEGAKVVLEGQRVLPSRTQQQGFKFKYGDIDSALRQILK